VNGGFGGCIFYVSPSKKDVKGRGATDNCAAIKSTNENRSLRINFDKFI